MNDKMVFTFIGGDKRQKDAILIFAREGFLIKTYGLSNINHENVQMYDKLDRELFDSGVLMLPIPYCNTKGNINIRETNAELTAETVLGSLPKGVLVILGRADAAFKSLAKKYNITYYDILEEEPFSVLNAIPTAEGAIQLAMERSDITLHGSNVLILGYGRIGRSLARMLKGIGANVTVEARSNSDLAWIYESGYKGIHLRELDTVLDSQNFIFNTIPSLIINRARLKQIRPSCIIIDLATFPGGTDFEAARELGIRADLDLGLPGIVAPKTAADIVCQVTKEILKRHFQNDYNIGG